MALPNGISWLHCAGAGLILIGLILHIVGLATPNWTTISTPRATITNGLFSVCLDTCVYIPAIDRIGEWSTAGAFAILALMPGLLAFYLSCLHIDRHIHGRPENSYTKSGTLATGITAILCVFLSCFVYGAGVHKKIAEVFDADIGYSFIMSAVGGVVFFLGCLLFYTTV
ncbi:uncharacterized protein LOC106078873 [Biomphalaria glabrata]|uniref:Uncharacterized protein LOC106078873 n=1 Tax=Biomphalaria glabrata TaxID=6526 RepID=A0A9W2Z3A1_BIOGL|nr:uncharacterized protein LOC106078873 [Biomphalaria glabrata]XP_055869424.1 uncharacterized protein LOC106078873 [Biomphalaria glabrata]